MLSGPAISVCEINGRHVAIGDRKLSSSDLLHSSWRQSWGLAAQPAKVGGARCAWE